MIRRGDRVTSKGSKDRGTVTATDGTITRVKWDLLRGSPDYLIACVDLEIIKGIQINESYPTCSANTCAMLRIPLHWAGVPMHECRFRTILANR